MKPINIVFIGILSLSLSLLTYTVVVSVSSPVQMENVFLDNYKNVDRNYNEIKKQEKIFDKNIDFTYKIIKKNNKYQINVSLLSNMYKSFTITSLLTRPHTNINNQDLNVILDNNNQYIIALPSIPKGRWRIILKINTSSITVFKTIDFSI